MRVLVSFAPKTDCSDAWLMGKPSLPIARAIMHYLVSHSHNTAHPQPRICIYYALCLRGGSERFKQTIIPQSTRFEWAKLINCFRAFVAWIPSMHALCTALRKAIRLHWVHLQMLMAGSFTRLSMQWIRLRHHADNNFRWQLNEMQNGHLCHCVLLACVWESRCIANIIVIIIMKILWNGKIPKP